MIVILSVLMLGQSAFATAGTSMKAPDRGFSPGKSYAISDIESTSMQNGNLMLNMPLGSLPPGRGGMSAGVNLSYNSKLWDQHTTEVEDIFQAPAIRDILSLSAEGGWRYGYKYYFRVDFAGVDCSQSEIFNNKTQLVMPDGGTHTLVQGDSTNALSNEFDNSTIFPDGRPACGGTVSSGQTIKLFSIDNSFLRIEVTTDSDTDFNNNVWTLYAPDGTRVVNNPGSGVAQRIYDRNNNYIDIIETAVDSNYSNHKTVYLKDTELNRKVVIEYEADEDEEEEWTEDHIHSKGFEGADITTKVRWKNIAVNKIYLSGDFNAPSPHPTNYYREFPLNQVIRVVDQISLPEQISNSLFYEFQYNADSTSAMDVGWGEISRIKLPSTAYTDYEYQYDGTQTNPLDVGTILRNGVTEKTLTYDLEYDGSTTPTSEVWTYERTGDPTTSAEMTAPNGGVTTEYYGTSQTEPTPPTPPDFLQTENYKTELPDGTVIEKWYQSNAPGVSNVTGYPNTLFKANRFVKYEFTSIPNNSGTLTKTAVKEYSRDKNGNVTEVKEYDFFPYTGTGSVPRNTLDRPNGLPSGATPLRITKTEYYNDTPDAASTTYTDTDSYNVSTSPRLLGLAKSVEIQDSSNTPKSRSELTYDYTSYSSNTLGGNVTATKSWDSFKGGSSQSYSNPLTSTNAISSSASYDSYGNTTQTTDANGVQTTITYGSITTPTGTVSGLYPTQTEAASNYSGLKRTSTAVYDFYTGLVTSTTDEDNDVTSATEYDDLGRPTKVAVAVGLSAEIWTQTVYDDVNRMVIVKSDIETKGDAKKVAVQHYDQLGRVRLSRTIENPDTEDPTDEADGIKVQARYLTTSGYSYQLSSNPYRATTSGGAASEPSMGWTRSKTVNTGKHSEVETFAGATLPQPFLTSGDNTNSTGKVQTDIDGDRTLVTDQAGKQRISKSNALGQMTDVWEIMASSDASTVSVTFPNQSIAYGYQTSYSYDTVNNLSTVSQGSQTRTFTYSSLSRLLSATNPESGTISYEYDNNGNLTEKTDARSITTDYTYDALNRVTNRDYSDSTPDVTYTYDNVTNAKGKLTKVDNGFSKTEYSEFDILGRVTKSQQTTDGTAYPEMEYTYNLSGALIEQKYPSGRIVKNILDNNGDLSIVQSKKNSNYGFWNYAKSFTYTASGAVSSMQLGNFKWESTVFNSRLQPTQIALGTTQSASDVLKLDYTYNTPSTADNNGNVLSQTITVPTVGSNTGFTATQTYTYDSLNRIKDAKEMISTTETWKQAFIYDRFGNRNFDEANTTTLPKNCGTSPNFTVCTADRKVLNPEILTSNNRLKTDQDNDSIDDYVFDTAGNTTKDAPGRTFIYDAENKQIEVKNASNQTIGEYFYDGDGKRVKKVSDTETTIFVYDASGKLVEEYSTQIAAQQDAKVSYLTNDHLGSPRITTDQNGQTISRRDFQPFGEEIATSQRTQGLGYTDDTIRQKFTSYERDKEIDLDFAQNRYFNPKHGRFTTVDPVMASANIINPQTWNRYVYVGNNPVNITDPSGLIWGELNGTVRWFADEAAMKADGFTAYVAQVAWSQDGRTMYALNAGSAVPVAVQSAAEVFRHLAAWRAGAGAIGATASALGVPIATALALTAAYVAVMTSGNAPDAGAFDGPAIGRYTINNQIRMQNEADKLADKLAGEVNQSSTWKVGETSPSQLDPDDDPNKPTLRYAHKLDEKTLNHIRKWSTEKIINSLKPGSNQALTVYEDGVIAQGNHRIQVLRERGINVDQLPRENRVREKLSELGERKK